MIRRHDLVKHALARFCEDALLNPAVEDRGLLPKVNDVAKCPADIFLPDFFGRGTCVDVSIVSSHLHRIPAGVEPGFNAQKSEVAKNQKYLDVCSANGFSFIPFVMESLGGFGQQAGAIINKLAVMLSDRKGLSTTECSKSLRRKLNFVVIQAAASVVATQLPSEFFNY